MKWREEEGREEQRVEPCNVLTAADGGSPWRATSLASSHNAAALLSAPLGVWVSSCA